MADNVTAARHHEIRLVLACIQNAEFEAGRVLAPPTTAAEAAYIERQPGDQS